MGVPAIAGDIAGPYTPPSPNLPPVIATIQFGSTKVFIKNKSVALFPSVTLTDQGPLISSTLNSTTTLIEGSFVILGGSVTNLASGYNSGIVISIGAIGVLVN